MIALHRVALLGGLLMAPAWAPVSFAQATQPMPMGQGMMGMMGGDCPMMGMMGQGMMDQGMAGQGNMAAMMKGRLAFKKAELGITEAQSAAWNGYVEAVEGRMAKMQGMREAMMSTMQTGTPVQRMDARMSAMQAMLESMQALKPATEALYAVLADEQKAKADQLLGSGC